LAATALAGFSLWLSLEQHHTISLVAMQKSRGVRHSGIAAIAAIAVAVAVMAMAALFR